MDELDETVLNVAQRQKRAQIMRRYQAKIERAREMAKKRLAPQENIKKRAYAQARQIVRQRVAGKRGAEYEKLGPSEKIAIDRAVEGKQKLIKKIALRLIPRVKSAEQQRLHTFMKGQALQNHGQPEGKTQEGGSGHSSVREEFNQIFAENFPPMAERSARKQPQETTSTTARKKGGKDVKGNQSIIQYSKFEEERDCNSSAYKAIAKKANKSGISEDILGEVYNRGMDTWTEETGVSQQQYAFARVNSYINQGRSYFNEDADLHENAWNQLGQKKPVGNTLPAPARGSVPKHGRKFSEGDHVVPHTGPYAGQVHRVTSSRAGSVNIVRPNTPKYDSITVRAKHEHLSPATPEQAAKYKAEREAEHKRMFGEGRAPGTPSIKRYTRNDGTTALKSLNKWGKRKDWRDTEGGLAMAKEHAGVDKITEEREVELHDGGPSRNIKKATLIGNHKTQKDHVIIRTHDYLGKPKDLVIHKDWIKEEVQQTNENFIDGKGPGKPGDSARHGLKGKSAAELRKIRSSETASPRKKQLAHWMLNMHHNESVDEGLKDPKDNPCWKGYKPVGTKKKAGKTVPNCVPVNEEERIDPKIKVEGTNCRNCVYWRKDLEKPVTKEELNPNGGLKAPNKEYIAMSKRIDLGTLPGKDSDVKVKGFCDHDSIKDWVTERMCCSQWDSDGMIRDYKGQSPVMEADGESIKPQTTSPGSKHRKKIENVDRDTPHTEHGKQQQIQKKIIDEEGNSQPDPKKRLVGTDSLVKAYKKDTPGQSLDESFNIAFASGVGVTLTAADLGMRAQGAFALHPSVIEEMERRAAEEVEEEVRSADVKGVVVRTATGKAVVRKQKANRKIIGSGNLTDGKPDDTL